MSHVGCDGKRAALQWKWCLLQEEPDAGGRSKIHTEACSEQFIIRSFLCICGGSSSSAPGFPQMLRILAWSWHQGSPSKRDISLPACPIRLRAPPASLENKNNPSILNCNLPHVRFPLQPDRCPLPRAHWTPSLSHSSTFYLHKCSEQQPPPLILSSWLNINCICRLMSSLSSVFGIRS